MKNGITKRFLINGVGVVVVLLILVVCLLFFWSRSFYYQAVESELTSYANTSLDLFNSYMAESDYDVEAGMRDFVENFRDREIVEIQLLNEKGEVLLSSSGFLPEDGMEEDWRNALESDTSIGVWRGKSSLGEHVTSACVALKREGTVQGGLRYISSLRLVDQRLYLLLGGLTAAALLLMAVVLLLSFYFISSILNPIKELDKTARSIATGNYEARIEKHREDEIGHLCDTINYMAGEIGNTERMKNEFVSSVSHELRTPLTAIKGWSETLRELGEEDPELRRRGLSIIESESERLFGMVEELLDFSRMQSGRLSMRMEKMDLLAELEEILVLFRERAAREGLTLQYVDPPSFPPIVGDKDRLRQVFINVLENAIKYTPSGGKIRVEAANMGAAVQVVISDNGIGIPAADLPLVKDKFYRVNKNGSISGSGIGLALADEIMKAHGGQLELESTEHVGTSVILTLPIKPDAGA